MAVRGDWVATAGTDGQLRVTHTKPGSTLHKQVAVGSGVNRDQACSVTWCDGGSTTTSTQQQQQQPRTLVCVAQRSQAVALYRMRKKKDAATSDPFPYELIELVKRRFSIAEKGTLNASSAVQVFADTAHTTPNNTLVVTACRDLEHGNVTLWDNAGEAVGTLTLPGSGVRLSPDGRFVCGRVNGTSTQVKLYEIQRKKIKDVMEPVFDKVTPTKAAMTLVTKSSKIVDIDFPGAAGSDSGGAVLCKRAVIVCVDGSLQLWDLDVEFRQRQDPKLLCSCSNLLPNDATIHLLAAGDSNRIAVVSGQSELYLLSFHDGATPHFTLDCSISAAHDDGVGDVQFGPGSHCVFTRGAYSNNVFAWNAE